MVTTSWKSGAALLSLLTIVLGGWLWAARVASSPSVGLQAVPDVWPLERGITRSLLPASSDAGLWAAFTRHRELLEATRYAPLSLRAQSGRVMILTYHDVIASRRVPGAVWFDATAAEFETQIGSLLKRGVVPISLAKLHRHLTTGEAVPERSVVITFDDNYQGFYDHAYPLIQRLKIPVAMFVHTDYVGVKSGRPKMTWNTLRELGAGGLVTIGSHSKSHPADLSQLSKAAQLEELAESKALLEAQLHHPVPFISYPNGKADATTWRIAREAGYTMGFMEEWTLAEASPDMLGINRYINTQLERAWNDLERSNQTQPALRIRKLKSADVRLERRYTDGAALAVVRGGWPRSLLSKTRESVGQVVRDSGAAAGVNGSFFTDARLIGTDNTMIGPVLVAGGSLKPERNAALLERIAGRPLVLWGRSQIAILPFQPASMNRLAPLSALMPDLSDAFLGGAWIVHDGKPRSAAQLYGLAPADSSDRRPRVFMGFTATGEVMLGASLTPVSTAQLGRAAAHAGALEAVLLDSGYSTSLVYGNRVLAVGRKFADVPSRPVPHAIVLDGQVQAPLEEQLKSWVSLARLAY